MRLNDIPLPGLYGPKADEKVSSGCRARITIAPASVAMQPSLGPGNQRGRIAWRIFGDVLRRFRQGGKRRAGPNYRIRHGSSRSIASSCVITRPASMNFGPRVGKCCRRSSPLYMSMRGTVRRARSAIAVDLRLFGWDRSLIATLGHSTLPWFDGFATGVSLDATPMAEAG